MGTTVTTNLGLIKPDTAESIKANLPTFAGWAAQESSNMDAIDGLFHDDFGTYTLNWTASSVNPTLGAGGFTEGKWIRVFPRMAFVFFRIFTGGAGFATGTGTYRVNLPFNIDAALIGFDTDSPPLGKAVFFDASAVLTSSVFLPIYSQGVNTAIFRPSSGNVWNDTTPVVPAQNDRISGYFMYPTIDP